MDNQKWAGGEQAARADVSGEFLREGPQSTEDIGERYGLDGSEYAPGRYGAAQAQELGRETLEAVPYAGVPVPAGVQGGSTMPEIHNDVMKAEMTGEAIGTDRPNIRDMDGLDKDTERELKQGLSKYKDDPKELSDFVRRSIYNFIKGRYGREIGANEKTDPAQFADSQGRSLFVGEEKKAA